MGISCHGPRGEGQDSMEKVLLAAVEDGRFDLMLFVYNFMSREVGEKILSACKEKNIGTTAMKVYAGKLEFVPFDSKNPTEEQLKYIKALTERGMERDKTIAYLTMRYKAAQKEVELHKAVIDAFVAEHGVKTQDELDVASLRWVLGNTDLHSVCVSLSNFESVDKRLPLSGTRLTAANERFLGDYARVHGKYYCRHGCTDCLSFCPHGVPVSTVMRYSYYFNRAGREKLAMEKYAKLREVNGLRCLDCDGPCLGMCPYGVSIQASLLKAHGMLTLA